MSVEIVARIKSELEARGVSLNGNCGSFEITARVAWALRSAGARLVVKRPEQNGCVHRGVKYSHDAIAFPSGWIDCLAGAGPPDNENRPVWNPTGVSPDAQLAAPFDMDAELPVPSGPDPLDLVDSDALVAFRAKVEALALEGFKKLDAQHAEVLDFVNDIQKRQHALEVQIDALSKRMDAIWQR